MLPTQPIIFMEFCYYYPTSRDLRKHHSISSNIKSLLPQEVGMTKLYQSNVQIVPRITEVKAAVGLSLSIGPGCWDCHKCPYFISHIFYSSKTSPYRPLQPLII